MTNTSNNFDLSKTGYVAFDAMSLRQLIIDRLNEQKVFTDQNFVGSNLAAIIDIISYAYHTLIFYLNKTASESMFTEAQLYENINRIVKLIDYSPVGFQTSTLTFNCSAQNLERGLYTIPRYSFGLVSNIPFSFNEEISFVKNQDNTAEFLTEISTQKLLYQGSYQEYPTYTAAGDSYETIILNTSNNLVDHFNIDVYVKPTSTNKWEEYTKTANLSLESSSAKKYEIRLNQNLRYEIKFGNDINGRKLQTGDQIAIYYLVSQGEAGEIGVGALNESAFLVRYNTIRYNQIMSDLYSNYNNFFLSNTGLANLVFTNTFNATPVKLPDSVDDIRTLAPANYKSQNRLVTTQDFEIFIKTNFTNLVSDVKCLNNWEYISGYLKYYYDTGLTDPSKTNRALFNQVQYADSCNFNNIYLLVVPRSTGLNSNYLQPAQKQLILTSLESKKMATVEPTFIDPIYKNISIGITDSDNFDPVTEQETTRLVIQKNPLSRRDNQIIIADVINVFTTYFANNFLGKRIETNLLTQQILGIEGIQNIHTVRTDAPNLRTEGISFFVWNSEYIEFDKFSTTASIPLNVFEYANFIDFETLSSKISISTTVPTFETTEY